ncbi:hypothetical protein NE236_24585 [Actinoallomurus purpureus]|uniref:hypothetical protein n=1 Tax=Actinoallomurus purpureus TaxID=478114 RepID=UPI002091FD60|nr:hypothetical protein [Actinoallomurus purpureus]MCO6008161.1 hypothetical protein [Actinoallomurus purpureus]
METVEDHTSAARLFITGTLIMDPRMSHEKLMAAQAEAALADGVAAAVWDGRAVVRRGARHRRRPLPSAGRRTVRRGARRVLAAALVAPADSASRPV